jgi:hypothetical protein
VSAREGLSSGPIRIEKKEAKLRDVELRRRMERMLHGLFEPDDLNRVILSLRGRAYGRQSVQELGNFVAHSDEREKGLVTDTARGFFASIKLHLRIISGGPIDLRDAPEFLPLALQTSIANIDEQQLRREIGYNRRNARRCLMSALSKLTRNATGGYSLRAGATLDPQEGRVVDYLARTLVVKSAFTDGVLVQDLWFILLRNHLVREDERSLFSV